MKFKLDKSKLKDLRLAASILAAVALLAGWVSRHSRAAETVDSPTQFSSSTWKQALLETKNAFSNKSLSILAAGVAYFSTLAFFPMMAAAVAIAALVINDDQILVVASEIERYLPADMASLVSTQLITLAGDNGSNIAIIVVSILLSLFGASGAVQNLITATNTAYGVDESRGFIKTKLLSLTMTLGVILVGFVVLALLLVNSSFLGGLGVPGGLIDLVLIVRWPLLAVMMVVALAVFYRYGPNRHDPPWQWVSWGAMIAIGFWLLATVLFFVYAQYFANYSQTYSLYAGIIVMMLWLNISALVVLLGAEINHRLEAQR